MYISKYISEVEKNENREIVSFRSCVRASEAVCAREAMLLAGAREKKLGKSSGPVRSAPLRALPHVVHMYTLWETIF